MQHLLERVKQLGVLETWRKKFDKEKTYHVNVLPEEFRFDGADLGRNDSWKRLTGQYQTVHAR